MNFIVMFYNDNLETKFRGSFSHAFIIEVDFAQSQTFFEKHF